MGDIAWYALIPIALLIITVIAIVIENRIKRLESERNAACDLNAALLAENCRLREMINTNSRLREKTSVKGHFVIWDEALKEK